jgi:hypothetical protein
MIAELSKRKPRNMITSNRSISMQDYDAIKQDFNEIANIDESKWDHNNCYFDYLMRYVPEGAGECLDIG